MLLILLAVLALAQDEAPPVEPEETLDDRIEDIETVIKERTEDLELIASNTARLLELVEAIADASDGGDEGDTGIEDDTEVDVETSEQL